MITDADGDPTTTVMARVAVKAPPFWRANAEIWFKQMESQFVLAGVTSEATKFHHVVSALQPEELQIVGDIIMKPPEVDPYTAIKKRLSVQYADTQEDRLRDLISGLQLGDRKPSRLLLEMKSKAGSVGDDLLKTLFLQRLPTHVQQILAISNDKLEKLAEMADGIMAASGSSTIQAVSTPEDPLQAMLLDISNRLARLETSQAGRSRSHSRDAGRTPFRQRSRSRTPEPGYCWYHHRFGQRATNCNQPCTFQAGN